MQKTKKCLGLLLSLMLFTSAIPMASMAASNKIESVTLTVKSNIVAGDTDGDIEVTSGSSNKYSVTNVEVTNIPEDGWDGGNKPKFEVTLETKDGSDYFFDSGFGKNNVKLKGDDATVNSVNREDRNTLIVKMTLKAIEGSKDYNLVIDSATWNGDGEATWSVAEDAKRYEVRLYRGKDTVTDILTVKDDNYYDFGGDITKSGSYTFKVRGVYSSSEKGAWVESAKWSVTSDEAKDLSYGRNPSPKNDNTNNTTSTNSGGPGNNSNGPSGPSEPGGNSVDQWLTAADGSGRWWYRHANGSYTTNNWELINNKWYYFDEAGWMVTGWRLVNNLWYYMGPSGDMLTGWQNVNGLMYYLDTTSGAMWANTNTPDGHFVNESGAMVY